MSRITKIGALYIDSIGQKQRFGLSLLRVIFDRVCKLWRPSDVRFGVSRHLWCGLRCPIAVFAERARSFTITVAIVVRWLEV